MIAAVFCYCQSQPFGAARSIMLSYQNCLKAAHFINSATSSFVLMESDDLILHKHSLQQ